MKWSVIGSAWLRWVSRSGVLFALLLLSGCGGGEGKVSGQVKFAGAPLPGGILLFRPADPKQAWSVSATLDEQGHYEAVVPAGEVLVSVDNRALQPHEPPFRGAPPGLPGGIAQKIAEAKQKNPAERKAAGSVDPNMRGSIPGKYVKIPDKYYSISSSGLKFTVQRGNQPLDIELK